MSEYVIPSPTLVACAVLLAVSLHAIYRNRVRSAAREAASAAAAKAQLAALLADLEAVANQVTADLPKTFTDEQRGTRPE